MTALAMPFQLPADWLDSPLLIEAYESLGRTITREREKRLKFYNDITPEVKWEFINGEVVMHSPALHRHTKVMQNLFKLLDIHCQRYSTGIVCVEKALCTFPRNDYEPDIVFFGQTKVSLITPDTLRYPIPDFIVEVISPNTEKRDRGVKKQDYAAHGVAEYWIIDPAARTVEQFINQGTTYPARVTPKRKGTISSEAVAGFTIPVAAIFDDAQNWAALQSLMAV